MIDYPKKIETFLNSLGWEKHAEGILKINTGKKIVDVDSPKKFIIDLNSSLGKDVEDVFPFLIGFLPLNEPMLSLKNIEITDSAYLNAYLIKEKSDTWLILQDNSQEVANYKSLVQNFNRNDYFSGSNSMLQKLREKTYSNEMLARESELLKQSLFQRNQFVSIISHDLRSPLTSLITLTEFMAEDDGFMLKINKEEQEYIQYMNKELTRIIDYVDKLSGWSKLTTGRFELNKKQININELINASVEILKKTIASKAQEIIINVSGKSKIQVDESLFLQLINNLLSNASKFTPIEGKIQLSYKQHKEYAELIVKDSGIGIENIDKEILFSDLNYFTTSGTRGERGTGLGLSICKKICDAHGFLINFSSEKNKGTSFIIRMPN